MYDITHKKCLSQMGFQWLKTTLDGSEHLWDIVYNPAGRYDYTYAILNWMLELKLRPIPNILSLQVNKLEAPCEASIFYKHMFNSFLCFVNNLCATLSARERQPSWNSILRRALFTVLSPQNINYTLCVWKPASCSCQNSNLFKIN